MPARQAAPCLRCGEMIDINVAAIVADIRLRVVGFEEAVRSAQRSVSFCVTCAELIAKGDAPPERTQPLNFIVYEGAREIISGDPSFSLLSWLQLRKDCGLESPTFVEPRVLRAWNDFRKTLALPPTLADGEGKTALVKAS
jgi:hypothetical protein